MIWGLQIHGRQLLEICKSSGHRIVNGRILGDSIGYYTFFSSKGCSLVDYFLTQESLQDIYLKVQPEIHLSDHSLLTLGISTDSNTPDETDNTPSNPHLDHLSGGRKGFNTGSPPATGPMPQTNPYHRRALNGSHTSKELTDILYEAGKRSLKLTNKKSPRKQSRPKPKKWYDTDCLTLRTGIRNLRRQVAKDPYNRHLRST